MEPPLHQPLVPVLELEQLKGPEKELQTVPDQLPAPLLQLPRRLPRPQPPAREMETEEIRTTTITSEPLSCLFKYWYRTRSSAMGRDMYT